MADKKISALTAASTPLAGTEVLPIVQSGSTVKVSVANLTVGRAVAMAGGSFTDNITQSTAAKGINFTANTPAAGMTSQLLNWYEEGTWTVGIKGDATAGTYSTSNSGRYTRIGNMVTVQASFVDISVTSAGSGGWLVTGLPFTIANTSAESRAPIGVLNLRQLGTAVSAAKSIFVLGVANTTTAYLMYFDGTDNAAIDVTSISSGVTDFGFTMTYFV